MSTYVIATRGPVDIACPSWCRITKQEHLDDLLNQEGTCFHWSPDHLGDGWNIAVQTYTLPDGSPADDEGAWVHIESKSDGLTLERAEALARGILAAVEEARS
jgi:hypothetical protein